MQYRTAEQVSTQKNTEGVDWRREPTNSIQSALSQNHIHIIPPELANTYADQEVRDQDNGRRPNLNCSQMCTTVPNLEEILPRGQVLLKKEKMGKLTTAFSPVPYTVVSKKGNSTIIVTTTSALHA